MTNGKLTEQRLLYGMLIGAMFLCYRWAASTVMTRMNNIPSEEDPTAPVPALIPFWDLCNHSNGRVSYIFAIL